MTTRHGPRQRNSGPNALRKRHQSLQVSTVGQWAKMSTLVDTCTEGSISSAIWPVSFGSIASGSTGFTATSAANDTVYSGVNSGQYDLTNSQLIVELPNYGNQSLASWEIYIQCLIDASDWVGFYFNGGFVYFQYVFNVPGSGTSTGYAPAIGMALSSSTRWFKISESNGIVTWDVSADGVTWGVNASSLADPIQLANVNVQMMAGTYANEASGTSATFAYVNGAAPSAGVPVAQVSAPSALAGVSPSPSVPIVAGSAPSALAGVQSNAGAAAVAGSAPSALAGLQVKPGIPTVTASAPSPTVVAGKLVNAPVSVVSASAPQPSILAGRNVNPVASTVSASAPQPSVQFGTFSPVGSVVASAPSPTVVAFTPDPERIYVVPAEDRVVSVFVEDRTANVLAEVREVVVPAEDRIELVNFEDRVVSVT